MISIPMYIGTIIVVVLASVFFIYFFQRIKKENKERAKTIHVPETFEKLWVEIDKRHRVLRSHFTQNKDQILLQGTIEEYEALLTKYKNKIYELRQDFRNDN